jgi:D-glycero-D-manno-heptose 1,7-bisphosphate phosphatase
VSRLPRLVLLDRDGTINRLVAHDYVRRPRQLELLPGAGSAIARLNGAGIRVAVVTNQRGVARGLMSAADLEAVTAHLDRLLAARGAHVDATFACTHGLGQCDCRKPAPGIVLRALADAGVDDPRECILVGDRSSDAAAAAAAGVPALLIGHAVRDLRHAVDRILGAESDDTVTGGKTGI